MGNFPSVAGPYVMIAVTDTGCGMDAGTRSRIFEPFFTTKEPGRGTGLGLSIVYAVVKQNGGEIWVHSEPETGTTFKIYFPQSDARPTAEPANPVNLVAPSETILVVEDDPTVRQFVHAVLERAGYRVICAEQGREAVEVYQQRENTIDLVLTDLVMPEMDGTVLASKLKNLNPAVRVLYMSGYAADADVRHGCLDGGIPLMQKPFSPNDLLKKVREALSQSAVAHG